jgi:hypothetical protein
MPAALGRTEATAPRTSGDTASLQVCGECDKPSHHLHVQMNMQMNMYLQSHFAIHSLMCSCKCIEDVRLQSSDDDRQCCGAARSILFRDLERDDAGHERHSG